MLIHGGGGGVGHTAIQLAKLKGAFVIATGRNAYSSFLQVPNELWWLSLSRSWEARGLRGVRLLSADVHLMGCGTCKASLSWHAAHHALLDPPAQEVYLCICGPMLLVSPEAGA